MSNYMDVFEKELERWIIRAGYVENDPSWAEWKSGFTRFLKEKLLESYRNGLKGGRTNRVRRVPSR